MDSDLRKHRGNLYTCCLRVLTTVYNVEPVQREAVLVAESRADSSLFPATWQQWSLAQEVPFDANAEPIELQNQTKHLIYLNVLKENINCNISTIKTKNI